MKSVGGGRHPSGRALRGEAWHEVLREGDFNRPEQLPRVYHPRHCLSTKMQTRCVLKSSGTWSGHNRQL